jgi:hypothetical protein
LDRAPHLRKQQNLYRRTGLVSRRGANGKQSQRQLAQVDVDVPGVIAALQLYFVRELLAAFALFALGFAGIAVCLASPYLAQKGWESGVARLAASQNSWVLAARRATAVSEEWVRRPLRRPDSEPAH